MSLAKTIGKNTAYGVADKITQLGTRLILVPIVTGHIGLDGYGVWAILMVIMAHMRFGAIGVKSAFQKYVAEATGSGDYDRANRLLSTGAAAMLLLSVAVLVPVAFFALPLVKALGVPETFLAETARACTVLAVIMVMSNFAGVFESIVMGAQRIDIVKKTTIVFLVIEALAITLLLHLGCGLFFMTLVISLSELCRLGCYFVIARRVAPRIHVSQKHLNRQVLPELFRFAGTYQLSNILEVICTAILPVAVLKFYGAEAAGIFAISLRLVIVGSLFLEALLFPLLSGGAMVHGAGSEEKLRTLLHKSFKTGLVFAMLPLAFVAIFGEHLVMAWVGKQHVFLQLGLWFFCLARLFHCLSMVFYVFYRATGGALMDIARQVMRLSLLLALVYFAGKFFEYYQLMAGFALIELLGMIFIYKALMKKITRFDSRWLTPDLLKMILCLALILATAICISGAMNRIELTDRWLALAQIIAGCMVFAAVGIPCLLVSRYFTSEELKAVRIPFVSNRIQGGKKTP